MLDNTSYDNLPGKQQVMDLQLATPRPAEGSGIVPSSSVAGASGHFTARFSPATKHALQPPQHPSRGPL